MAPAYLYRDKEPMGTNIAYRLLPQTFDGNIILASKKWAASTSSFAYLKGSVYISIGKKLSIDSLGLDQLLEYVRRGNEYFLSDEHFDTRLLDSLGVKQQSDYIQNEFQESISNTYVQIADSALYGNKKYGFYFYPFNHYFSTYDSSNSKALGLNDNKKVNYLVIRLGKGKFYLHGEPAAFTNYFLLTDNNTNYYSQVLSYLNKDAHSVIWGDLGYFGKQRDDFSALQIFWNSRLLTFALLLFCLLALLYIAFGSKRKRRLVPVQLPNKNESLSFVQTIGNLYLQKKDNRKIAIKKLSYFMEYVRSNYFLATHTINKEFMEALSRKSGVDFNKVQQLMGQIEYLNNTDAISDQELFDINNLLYEFYKR
jgi:hypothetical protein